MFPRIFERALARKLLKTEGKPLRGKEKRII